MDKMYIPRHATTLTPRSLYSDPPAAQDAVTNNPTLLVSWWCTCFALAIILVRLGGRWIRTERLFVEDKIMAASIVPLLARMACAHFVIRWGTNNAMVDGLSPDDLWRREIGSQLVLPARILYAAFLWTAKLTIAEFLRRLYSSMWKRSWEVTTHGIRWFLGVTFIAVVVATLTECQPFSHYWQVTPDPGPHCRQGFVQLITMGVSDTITDLVLVAFPVPVILASSMPLQRKLSLCALFALSLSLVAITIYRVTATIDRHAEQQFRSLVASFEILAAAAVANALVLGSFVRDRGIKKAKYKRRPDDAAVGSIAAGACKDGSLDRPSTAKARNTRALSWGSEGDLAGEFGFRLGPELQADRKSGVARPAPIALPFDLKRSHGSLGQSPETSDGDGSTKEGVDPLEHVESKDIEAAAGTTSPPPRQRLPGPNDGLTPRRMSFFDVGGLLDVTPAAQPTQQGKERKASAATVNFPFSPTKASGSSTPARKLSVGSTSRKRSVPSIPPEFFAEMRDIPEAEREDPALREVKSA